MSSTSTTLNEAREAIYQAFVDGWGATTAYTFDNEKFTPPDQTPWVRLTVRHQDAGQETLGGTGNRKFYRKGSVFIQVFVPTDDGTANADTYLALARSIFEGTRIAGTTVRFLDVIVRETGPAKSLYEATVEAAFEYDEIK